MTCRDIMTADPVCCLPHDIAARAAQIMRAEDVGSVPVVSDQHEKRLAGIVTDRDLALKIVAEGRDPSTTPVENVMTRDPVTCRAEDDTQDAIDVMSGHQIRRLPIVDQDGMLIGIVAQADIARLDHDADVGQMVEEISEPGGMGGMISGFRRTGRRTDRESFDETYTGQPGILENLMVGSICVAMGAGLMYIFDPNRGRTRRAKARDKAVHYYNKSGDFVRKTQRDMSNRASGIAAQIRSMRAGDEPVSDEKLVARARSYMGRIVSHPHAIHISARNGHLTLDGPILEHEVNSLVQCLTAMNGVTSLDNRLEVHHGRDIPDLQGGTDRPGQRMEFFQSNWSPAARTLAGALGSGMALWGAASRSPVAMATGALGVGLLARSIANKEISKMVDFERVREGARGLGERVPQMVEPNRG